MFTDKELGEIIKVVVMSNTPYGKQLTCFVTMEEYNMEETP
jgi:hypothetical protein